MSKFKKFCLHPLTITILYPFIVLLLFLWTKESTFFVIFICFVLGFSSIILHEIGHLLASFIVGSKFYFMSAGPFLILPGKQRELKVSLNSDTNMMFGLQSSYIPLDYLSDKMLQKKMIPTYLGGPLINLVAIGIGFFLRLLPIENIWLWDTISYFIIINIALLCATAIPFSSDTDGGKILELIHKKNMWTYRIYNYYLNPNYKLASQDTALLEQQLIIAPKLNQCYNLGIMLINEHTSKLSYERSLYVIDLLESKLTKEDGPIFENLINFYRALILWVSKKQIDEDTLMRLKQINHTYGLTFFHLTEAMVMYAKEDKESKRYIQLLNDSQKSIHELMDHNQESILSNVIYSIQKEMCA